MYGALSDFRKFIQYEKCFIDNATFRLHYKYTFTLLLVASLLTTANQFIGDNINCMVEGVPDRIMNSYCWIQGTFTIPSQLSSLTGRYVNNHGAAAPTAGENAAKDVTVYDKEDFVGHAWYQWVCFILFIQAVMCYLPHHIWKAWEGGKLSMIITGLDQPMIEEKEEKENQRKNVVQYLINTRGTHTIYAYKFLLCEFLNLFNIMVIVYLMDIFLGYQFTTYGTDVLRMTQLPIEDRHDHMAKVFPRLTKCDLHYFGPSGTKENKDALCILSVNIINEKIFIILWFWYIILIIWTAIHLLSRLLILISSSCRILSLWYSAWPLSKNDINIVMHKCNYGDWFLLTQMSNHIDPPTFLKIMGDLKKNIHIKGNPSVRVSNSRGSTNV